jgi:hypothetical protein
VDAADAEAASPILFVQTDAREVTNTSNPVAFASAATAGDAIIVAIDFPTSSGATVTSVEDTLTNTYQSALGPYDGSGSRQYVYYAINRETGSNTVTVNLSATARCEVYIHEYSGLAATGTLDVGAVDSASGASDEDGGLVVGPITTNAPNELVFAFATCSDSCLPGSGFRQRSNFDGNFTADTIGKTSGSYELVGTATKGPWVASLLAFRGL